MRRTINIGTCEGQCSWATIINEPQQGGSIELLRRKEPKQPLSILRRNVTGRADVNKYIETRDINTSQLHGNRQYIYPDTYVNMHTILFSRWASWLRMNFLRSMEALKFNRSVEIVGHGSVASPNVFRSSLQEGFNAIRRAAGPSSPFFKFPLLEQLAIW